jgi:hypothetical protein
MTQYFYVDESGDAGLEGQASSSSHFVMAMVQLPERAPLQPLANLRKAFNVSSGFEFKYHKTTPMQKERFFKEILMTPFRVRAVVLDKTQIGLLFNMLSSRDLMIELIVGLTLRASELDISNDILIIDGASPALCRDLRVHFTERYKSERRIRPFKNIIGADSKNEDGLQVADMIAGALRLGAMGISSEPLQLVYPRIVDLWRLP